MEVLGVRLEMPWLVIGVICGVAVAVLFFWFHRVKISEPSRRLSIPAIIFSMVGTAASVYYILNMIFGSGRTGWP